MDDPSNEFIIYPLFQCKYSEIFRKLLVNMFAVFKKKKKENFNAFYDEYENVDKFFVFVISFEKLKRVLF